MLEGGGEGWSSRGGPSAICMGGARIGPFSGPMQAKTPCFCPYGSIEWTGASRRAFINGRSIEAALQAEIKKCPASRVGHF